MRLSKASDLETGISCAYEERAYRAISLKKQHARAMSEATRILREEGGDSKRSFGVFELYTLRHTCLTRWAPHMDPWTLAYLAGHSNMNTTKRYIHPQGHTIRDAMQKARVVPGGHDFGHNAETGQSRRPKLLQSTNSLTLRWWALAGSNRGLLGVNQTL